MIDLVGYEGKLQLTRRIVELIVVKNDDVHIFLKGTIDCPDTKYSPEYVNELIQMCHIGTHSKRHAHHGERFHQRQRERPAPRL